MPTATLGQYLVYWWKDIALGHSFLEAAPAFWEEDALQQLAEGIAPAVAFYAGTKTEDWQQWIRSRNFEKLQEWLKEVLLSYETPSVPATVPVSVVICTRNRAVQLERCLQSLADQKAQPQQVVVVDNAPSDESTAEVAARFPHVTYVREKKVGLDIARNTGALAARCPVVAYTDDDVHLHPLWTFRLWETFEQNPQMAALTGLVIATELETEAQIIFEKFWTFNRGYTDKVYGRQFFDSNLRSGPPVWEIGAGANMAFRKTVFQQVGYFDELLDAGRAGCNGDSEIWFRILNHGLEIHYNPRVIAFHEHRRSMPDLQRQMFNYLRGFTVALLLQQDRQPAADYRRRLYVSLPLYHMNRIRQGFPRYGLQYRTMGAEVRGVVAGLFYYLKNKKHSSIIPYNAPTTK